MKRAAGQVNVSLSIIGPKKASHASLERGGQFLFRTLCACPPPHLCSTKGTLPLVPTHKEFLRHCWVHHDNWVLNKAFLLGILPFTGEGGGTTVKERESKRRGEDRGKGRGWRSLKLWEGTVEVTGVRAIDPGR